MKRKILYAIVGILVVASIAFVVEAQAQRGKRGPRGPRDRMAALELSDAQKQKMQALNSKHQKAMIDLRAAQQKAQIDLRELRGQDRPKASDIKSKVNALMSAQGKIMEREIQHGIDVKNVLTPEQQKKISEMRRNRSGRGGRSGFRGRGQGFRERGGPQFRGRGGPQFRGRGGQQPQRRGRPGSPRTPQPEAQSGMMEAPETTPSETSL